MRYLASIGPLLLTGCVISHPIGAGGEAEAPATPAEETAQQTGEDQAQPDPLNQQQTEAVAAGTTVGSRRDPPSRSPWQEIGRSVQGRSILMTTVGIGPRQVIWVGGIHGDEREGSFATEHLADEFRAMRDFTDMVTLHMIENLNPDGTALNRRGNANNVDLNRNFPAENFDTEDRRYGGEPLNQPESRILHDLILRVQPDLVVVAHAWRGGHFINYDGDAERSAILFSTLSDYSVRRSESISPTPGSLGSWVGVDLGIPILTLEYERGIDPEEAWRQTRLAILAVILGD